jgi:AcrR family transcriptional regulator
MSTKNPSPSRRPRAERGDGTREKLLSAAIDVFGRNGFDATTTRTLAQAAGVNLQAIPYYFGGKQGLYIAAAEHIASLIHAHTTDVRERTRTRLEEAEARGTAIGEGEARAMLTDIIRQMAALFIGQDSEPWVRFMIREQMAPTEAFQRVYGHVMKPMLGLAGALVAILLGEPPQSEHVRLRTLSLLGSVLVFRVAHALVLAHLGWERVGADEAEAVCALADELTASIGRPIVTG